MAFELRNNVRKVREQAMWVSGEEHVRGRRNSEDICGLKQARLKKHRAATDHGGPQRSL